MTFYKLQDEISGKIRSAQDKKIPNGDMPPDEIDLLAQRFEAFMSMQFVGFPILPELTDRDLYELTQSLKRHNEKMTPRDSVHSQHWAYYDPGYREVEEAYEVGDSKRLRRGIDTLINLKLHD